MPSLKQAACALYAGLACYGVAAAPGARPTCDRVVVESPAPDGSDYTSVTVRNASTETIRYCISGEVKGDWPPEFGGWAPFTYNIEDGSYAKRVCLWSLKPGEHHSIRWKRNFTRPPPGGWPAKSLSRDTFRFRADVSDAGHADGSCIAHSQEFVVHDLYIPRPTRRR